MTCVLYLDIVEIADRADNLSSVIRKRLPATDSELYGELHRIGLALHELARNTENAIGAMSDETRKNCEKLMASGGFFSLLEPRAIRHEHLPFETDLAQVKCDNSEESPVAALEQPSNRFR